MTSDTTIQSRPYAGDADLRAMTRFLQATGGPGEGYPHVGDLWWRIYQNTVFQPERDVRLWEGDGGELLGFAWLEEPDGVSMVAHPRLRGAGLLEGRMLEWGATHPAREAGDGPGELWTWASGEGDDALVRFLTARGFERDTFHMLRMHQTLDRDIPEPSLPDGWTVRHVGGEGEWEQRVETHREVWNPSKVTLPAYRRLRQAPGYVPELDLAAVGPDGAFGSYCICWLDPVNRTGEFEPVGTRPSHRRKGLGKAVILEGLRRLRERGAESAWVYSVWDNDASTRLYESAGFRVVGRDYLYGKKL